LQQNNASSKKDGTEKELMGMLDRGEGAEGPGQSIDLSGLKDLRNRVEDICNTRIVKHKTPSHRARALLKALSPPPVRVYPGAVAIGAASIQRLLDAKSRKKGPPRFLTASVKNISEEIVALEI
jgi:hypothetical protein